ncbi:hypothetical protein G7Z17_g1857 [Cylindrodendrum hubeiense]|uniref:Uncharacterized protein n=1 Tax=Cylindrodendrum hubeiense TaxID=595255 RepID=A0A9P5HDZ1_9HYPO|nr:hypothetical protein G7Z17_g1857 [Cylindrodendrum hubeiense]
MTEEMQEEYIKHLQTRAFCKPADDPSPTAHALCQSAITTLEFTWPKWMILATLYGSDHPDLAIMKKIMENQFGQADDLTSIARRVDGDVLVTCEGEAALNIEDFFDLLEHDDYPVRNGSGSMESRVSTPAVAHSTLSIPNEGDWSNILPRASELKKDALQSETPVHSSTSLVIATRQPQSLDTLCVTSNAPLPDPPSTQSAPETISSSDYKVLVQRMKALEMKMASDTSVLMNQRMKVLETHMDSDTSVLLYQRVEALEMHLDSDNSSLLNQRVKAIETRMASEASGVLEQRLKILEATLGDDTSSLLDLRLKTLETKVASDASYLLNQRVTKLETSVASNTSALMKQKKDSQQVISSLKEGQVSSQNTLHDRINRHTDRLDKMNIRIDRIGGRVIRIENDFFD